MTKKSKTKKIEIQKPKISGVIVLTVILALLAIVLISQEKLKTEEKKPSPIPGWNILEETAKTTIYSKGDENVTVTLKTLNPVEIVAKIKELFTEDSWDADNLFFAKTGLVCWVSETNMICFDQNPVPLSILNYYKEKFNPSPYIIDLAFPEPKKTVGCGNNKIEEKLGENCEPPEYMEVLNNKPVYICKTKNMDFYNIKCAKETCKCIFPDSKKEFTIVTPDTPLVPAGFCGNRIIDPGEQCEINIPCPPGFICRACMCVRPAVGPPKCGDGILQQGEECEWTPTKIPFLLVGCPKGFTCQFPGSPNACKCLTTVEPEREPMPLPEEQIEKKEKEEQVKCRECKVCSLEQAKAIIEELANKLSDLLTSEDPNLEDIIRAMLFLMPQTEISEYQTEVLRSDSESCEANSALKNYLIELRKFINSAIEEINKKLSEESETGVEIESAKLSLENFKAELEGLKTKIEQKLAQIENCDSTICETQQNNHWVKVDCDRCAKITEY